MSNEILFRQNFYELFNVSPDAPTIEIKHAYANLIKKYTNEKYPKEFMHIRQAYNTLSNPNLRAQYDEHIGLSMDDAEDDYKEDYSDNAYDYEEEYKEYKEYEKYEKEYEKRYEFEEQRYEEEAPSYSETKLNRFSNPDYSLMGNIIFSLILALFIHPIIGVIAAIFIHIVRIPIWKYTLGLAGCLIQIIIVLLIIGFIFG